MKEKHEILKLSNRSRLHNWLHGTGKNEWEKGIEWVLRLVEAEDVKKRTLVVLWDGEGQELELGGTAYTYRLAQVAGNIDIKIIDANLLTNTD